MNVKWQYRWDDGNGCDEEFEGTESELREHLRDECSDWGDGWWTARWRRVDDRDEDYWDDCECFRVDEDPPPCIDSDDHDWQSPHEIVGGIKENPGVWGNGGGVIINEVCMRCGCQKTTDTWATHPENGSQGHTVVTYDPDAYEDVFSDLAQEEY